MAFQAQGGQESQNRRNILQDLQQKRQLLLNQGQGSAANVGTNLSAMRAAGTDPSTSFKPHEAAVIRSPADLSLSQRQALEHANSTSSGYFISQDSSYGNLILPVLPRFESGELKMN
ncbi:SOSS complex subunit C homolog [Acropora muricata]|uniref:SOSS complex subunit C homolog n=1 Tax=Acropora millepora TaxID=45264 RepID=UPI0010FCB741|nr:SOSS complex subunit C homolog [Acropora millepora]XP_029200118.1 SOSS complex subunit C homolog [Acropora millepora]XP_029200119.1 SOSS complex subunit C homolog [Acropora millepora]